MRVPHLFFVSILCAFLTSSCKADSSPEKYRVLVSTDIGGSDPDDNQSMAHLLMYNDLFDLEGLVSSPSYGTGSVEELRRMIDIYEQDYPLLNSRQAGFLPPDSLRMISKQGSKVATPMAGYGVPTEGSEWIVRCARRDDARPLWVLVWGGLDDLAQALHDAPDICERIRVYWIGGPNKKWSVNSYAYIAENFPDLWFIENNASYRGFIADAKDPDHYQRGYYDACMQGAGTFGEDFANYYDGIIKMGDTPSLLYMMNGDPADPFGESWGGSFERQYYSPRTMFTADTSLKDTISVYSIAEFRFSGPVLDEPAGYPCLVMTVDKQEWTGYYAGNGTYCVRYAPKAPATLTYTISSEIATLDGRAGEFVVSGEWPGSKTEDSWILGENWFTDKSDPELFVGQWQGVHTVSKWRNDVLDDWAKRLDWLKNK